MMTSNSGKSTGLKSFSTFLTKSAEEFSVIMWLYSSSYSSYPELPESTLSVWPFPKRPLLPPLKDSLRCRESKDSPRSEIGIAASNLKKIVIVSIRALDSGERRRSLQLVA